MEPARTLPKSLTWSQVDGISLGRDFPAKLSAEIFKKVA
jgi:hypothetical protein